MSPGRYSFDSSDDYHDSLLSPAQRLARDIIDGEAPEDVMEEFQAFFQNTYPATNSIVALNRAVEYSTQYLKEIYH